ncbi:hypothetical protein HHX47_DHR2001047 [Lentinula edodes]|nr:hypothetical protein HHX47_DHR2001047 [Lentinula edodes]
MISLLNTILVTFWVSYAFADSLAEVEHIVLFMQENRAFDHYFDLWVEANMPQSWGHFRRSDLPVHFAIAEGWTVGDMYQQGVIASTNPNRVIWQTGSIAVPGGNVNTTQGPVLDNNETPGCSSLTQRLENGTEIDSPKNYTCYPFDWKTLPEYLEDAGISWKEFQAFDNFGDNPLPDFVFWQNLADNNATSELAQRGLAMNGGGNWQGGLDLLKKQAAEGTLPAVSFYIGPAELSEHPPYRPIDGGWLQKEVVNAIVNSPKYNKTILVISFDETGGWGDHVIPFTSPENTPGEWIINPFTGQPAPTGPGFRLPFTVISPWTRGGIVFTEPSDHISQTLFLEQWAAARPDYSAAPLPDTPPPHTDPLTSLLDGDVFCENTFSGHVQPPIPYGQQTPIDSLFTETGYKIVRGSLTEGRYLVIESSTKNLALSSNDSSLGTSAATNDKINTPSQRFVIHATDPKIATGKSFRISSAASITDATAISNATTPFLNVNLQFGSVNSSAVFNITYQGSGVYNFLESGSNKFLSLGDNGAPVLGSEAESFKIFSISF